MAASTPKKKKDKTLDRTPSLPFTPGTPSLNMTPSLPFTPGTPSLPFSPGGGGDSTIVDPTHLRLRPNPPMMEPGNYYPHTGITTMKYADVPPPGKEKPPETPDDEVRAREFANAGKHWIYRYYGDRTIRKTMASIDKNILNGNFEKAGAKIGSLYAYSKNLEPEIAKKLDSALSARFALHSLPSRFSSSRFEKLRRLEESMEKAFYDQRPREFTRSYNELVRMISHYDGDERADLEEFLDKHLNRDDYREFGKREGVDSPDQLFKEYQRDNPALKYKSTPLQKVKHDIPGATPIGVQTVFDPALTPIDATPAPKAPGKRAKKLTFEQDVVDAVMEDIRKMMLSDEPRAASSTNE